MAAETGARTAWSEVHHTLQDNVLVYFSVHRGRGIVFSEL